MIKITILTAHILVQVPRVTINVMFSVAIDQCSMCAAAAGFLGHNKIRKLNTHSFQHR